MREREQSISAIHTDWYLCSDSITLVCAVLDDAGRVILSGGEFSATSTENSINLLQDMKNTSTYYRYRMLSQIMEHRFMRTNVMYKEILSTPLRCSVRNYAEMIARVMEGQECA